MFYIKKMSEDFLEKPSCKILYRQTSLETRLSPIDLSKEDDSDEDEVEQCEIINPKIVDVKYKTPISNEIENVYRTTNSKDDSKIKALAGNLENVLLASKSNNQGKNECAVKPKIEPKPEVIYSTVNKNKNDATATSRLPKIVVTQNQGFNDLLKNELTQKFQKPQDRLPKVPEKPQRTKETARNEVEIEEAGKNETGEEEIKNEETGENEVKIEDVLVNSLATNNVRIPEQEPQNCSVGTFKALVIKPKRREEEEDNEETVGSSLSGSGTAKKEGMATLRPKSPRPVAVSAPKDESIWDKIGTLGRKKRIKEVQEVQAEGKYAIDSPGCATIPNLPPEDYNLDDNEERCMIDPRAYDDSKFHELLNVLKEWINDELASQRIIVQDIAEDLYDGQVLQKLLEKLTGDKLDVPEVTQSEEGQKQKLMVVLDHFNQILGIQRIDNKWNVEAIHSKNIVSIVHLLVALARHFRPPVRLPEHVSVDVVVVQKTRGQLLHKTVRESLTKAYDDVGMRCERDAFDTLFDHAPDKLQVVKKSLVTFVNKHLNKMNFEVTEIESQFHDGVYLIMLMGLLEGFFVPHYSFHLTPNEFEQKVQNVNFAFELMEEVGLQKPKARPEDVVNMDLKSTLRVLYVLFLKYRTVL